MEVCTKTCREIQEEIEFLSKERKRLIEIANNIGEGCPSFKTIMLKVSFYARIEQNMYALIPVAVRLLKKEIPEPLCK